MKKWQNRMTAAVLAGCIAAACGDSGPTGPSGPTDGTTPTRPTATTPTEPDSVENVGGVYHGTTRIVETLTSGGGETDDLTKEDCEAVVQEGNTVDLVRFKISGMLKASGDWDEVQAKEGEWLDAVIDSESWVRTTEGRLEGEIIAIWPALTFRHILEMTRSEERCTNAEIVAGS